MRKYWFMNGIPLPMVVFGVHSGRTKIEWLHESKTEIEIEILFLCVYFRMVYYI